MMPDVSDIEVLRYMRREAGLEKILVIFVYAKSMPYDVRDGLEAGALICFAKPIGYKDLKNAQTAWFRPYEHAT